MESGIAPIILGVIIIIIGVVNMTGNISTLHYYHRQRVTEENVKPFGRMVGLGTLLMGVGVAFFGGMMILADILQNDIFVILGATLMVVAFVVGIFLSFRAMKKYNGGIF